MRKPQLILVCIIAHLNLSSQTNYAASPSVYQQAQALAGKQDFNQAISLLQAHGNAVPLDRDHRLYLARLHFWTQQLYKAEILVEDLLADWPEDYQVHKLYIDLAESQELYQESCKRIKKAISIYPDDEKLHFRLAYNLKQSKQYSEAKDLTSELVNSFPEDIKILNLDKELKTKLSKNFFQAEYRNYFLNKRSQRLDFHSYRYGRDVGKSTLIAVFTSGRALSERGIQAGIELYTEVSKKSYTYFHMSYSDSDLFPDIRANAAIYQALDRNFETSLFISYLNVKKQVTSILSPSLSKNFRKATISATVNLINTASDIEITYRYRCRHYFSGHSNFVGLAYGSFSRNEMIRGELEQDITPNYLTYETQLSVHPKMYIGLSYNRTLTRTVKNRDQLHVYAKHTF